uniref:Nucleotide binding protein n=1 Tax=Solanum tuberosum TaxID=4113 RepID=M1BN12_SOLTU
MDDGDVSVEGKVTCASWIKRQLFELYGHEDNIKFVCKEFPLQDVGPQKCMAFSVDGSKLAIGGVDGHFRLFEWPTMRIIVDEPKAHKSFRDMDFSVGLVASHFSYVKNINPGILLFLFNYNNRELYGIYEAASSGKMNINPYSCTLDGS